MHEQNIICSQTQSRPQCLRPGQYGYITHKSRVLRYSSAHVVDVQRGPLICLAVWFFHYLIEFNFFSSVTCLGIQYTATAVLNGCDCYLWRTCYMLYRMENISSVLHRCVSGTRLWFLCLTINCVVSQRDFLLTKYNLQILSLITFGQVFMVKRKLRIHHKCAYMEDKN